jgi:hypothetical protein
MLLGDRLIVSHPAEHILLREWRYASGLIEVGVYTPEVLPGSGAVLVVTVDNSGDSRKWSVYTGTRRHFRIRGKRAAIAWAIELAKRTDSYAAAVNVLERHAA